MQVLSKVGFVKLYLVLAACAGWVQFIVPMEFGDELQTVPLTEKKTTAKKRSLLDRITGKGKKKITLVKGNIEERKEPWSYQVVVDGTKKSNPKKFYKDAIISFDLADGSNQELEVTGGTGHFKDGHILSIIRDGKLTADFNKYQVMIVGTQTIVNDQGVFFDANWYVATKSDINKYIQYQIDQLKDMKSVGAKVGRGLTTLKAGATQARQAFSRKKFTPESVPSEI